MKGFQVGVLIFFGLFVIVGVLIFSGMIKLPEKSKDGAPVLAGTVRIWGTVSRSDLAGAISIINERNEGLKIIYEEKDPRTYREDLLNAFAFGGVPDLLLLSQDLIMTYEDKIVLIPFTSFPERNYSDTYLRAADIFKKSNGFLGFPLFIDPLVLYYNQDTLETAGFTAPPKYWSDFYKYVPYLTEKNEAQQIVRSGVALGEFTNVKNAKEIFLSLLLQLNNNVIFQNASYKYDVKLNQPSDISTKPASQSLRFYSEFSDPLKSVYSWNKSKKEFSR